MDSVGEWNGLRYRADHTRGRLGLKPCLQRTGLLSVTLQLNLDKGIKKLTQQGTVLSLPCKVFFYFLCNARPYPCVLALLISVVKATCCNCLKINQQMLKLPSTSVEKYCKPQWCQSFFSLYPCQCQQGSSTYVAASRENLHHEMGSGAETPV